MSAQKTRAINDFQKEKYKDSEIGASQRLLEMYRGVLDSFKNRETVNILDIGGGNANFALAVNQYLAQSKNQYILDNTEYDSYPIDYGRIYLQIAIIHLKVEPPA